MQTTEPPLDSENAQSQLQLKYDSVLEQHLDLQQRVKELEEWMYDTYSIKKNIKILDIQLDKLQELIAKKFNIEFERMSNQFKTNIQKASDDKARLETKLNLAKEKQDKLSEEKKVIAVQKEKLNKRIQVMKADVQDKNKKLEGARKRISTLQTELSNEISQNKKWQIKFNQSQETIKMLRQKLKNKELQFLSMQNSYLDKIKTLNEQLGQSKNIQHSLQFNISQLQENIRKLQIEYKRKIDDLTMANQKRIRQTIASYQKQIDKKKKQFDSLYNTAAIRHEKALKSLTQKNEQGLKKQQQQYELKLGDERQKYKELRDTKWTIENALQNRISTLQSQLDALKNTISDSKIKIEKLQTECLQKTLLYDQITKKNDQNVQLLKRETEEFQKQRQSYQSKISKILEQKEKQSNSQQKVFKQTMKVLEFDYQQKMNNVRIKANQQKQIVRNSLRNQLMDKQQKHHLEISKLKEEFKKVKQSYDSVHTVYQNKFRVSENTFKQHASAINKRSEYEKDVIIEKKEREKAQMKSHYETIIYKYEKDFKAKVQEERLLITIEKDDIIQKQKIFYQQEIKSLARSIQIAGNQKVMGVQRKVKFVEKKLRDLEVDYQLVVKEKQILSKTSNTQLESMKELQELFKQEIEKMQYRHDEAQTKHEQHRSQLQSEITKLMNQIQQNKKQHQNKEQMIINSCKNRISKNQIQMKEFGNKMKQQFEGLQASYNQRYNVLAKSYKELEFLSAQKVSLPQDVQIMKVLHRGILEKQEDLRKEREIVVELRKQLIGKQQANKIFNMKKLDIHQKMNLGNNFPTFNKA